MCWDIFQRRTGTDEEGYEHAVCAVKEIVTGNIEAAMNEYNRKKKEK